MDSRCAVRELPTLEPFAPPDALRLPNSHFKKLQKEKYGVKDLHPFEFSLPETGWLERGGRSFGQS